LGRCRRSKKREKSEVGGGKDIETIRENEDLGVDARALFRKKL